MNSKFTTSKKKLASFRGFGGRVPIWVSVGFLTETVGCLVAECNESLVKITFGKRTL